MEFPQQVQRGIRMHRSIDSFTDSHPANLRARELFVKPYRRFAGIITDVAYDHYLARKWRNYSDISLQQHADIVYAALDQHVDILPPALQRFARVVIDRNVLVSYMEYEAVEVALQRIAMRSPRFKVLASAGDKARQLDLELADCFDEFFPELVQHVKDKY